jgi:hypothetical protein
MSVALNVSRIGASETPPLICTTPCTHMMSSLEPSDKWFQLSPSVSAIFHTAGHI